MDGAGAISLGKTTAPEFGFPAYTEPLAGPIARNPWDLTRTAGGSSGGAAVAVAAGLLPFAPGSDAGGSIRIPAAACGLVGLKPTRGLLAAGGGLDGPGGLATNGPIARTVADAALLLEGMISRDARGAGARPYTLSREPGPAGSYLTSALSLSSRPLKIGVSTFSAWDGFYDIALSPDAQAAFDAGADALSRLGHQVVPLDREPDLTYAPAFRTLWMASAAALPIDDPRRLEKLEPLTQWLVAAGRAVSARALMEALRTLTAFERATLRWIAPFDAVLLPALAMVPPPLGWFDAADPERNFAQQCQFTPYTSMINVAGLPAIAVPTRWTAPTPTAPRGMPMGVQLAGQPGGERVLLALAAQLEDVIRWHHTPVW
jgi:amidase